MHLATHLETFRGLVGEQFARDITQAEILYEAMRPIESVTSSLIQLLLIVDSR